MTNVLIARLSRLGNVITAFPAVTDISSAFGRETAIEMVVEEGLESIALTHPAISDVIVVAQRRWRRDINAQSMREFLSYLRALRQNAMTQSLTLMGK